MRISTETPLAGPEVTLQIQVRVSVMEGPSASEDGAGPLLGRTTTLAVSRCVDTRRLYIVDRADAGVVEAAQVLLADLGQKFGRDAPAALVPQEPRTRVCQASVLGRSFCGGEISQWGCEYKEDHV